MLIPLVSGGAVGALITAWVQHRRGRMQPIPLIERVNRLVTADLKGFVLARVGIEGGGREGRNLEVVERVREYQFTLRNTSHIHLHNAEVQFEFPSKDVEGRAERPVRSKTIPVQVGVVRTEISEPWKAGFRWRVPELPPGDSIEFTFRAVDPSSDDYEVALYNGGQVVIEKSKGEPLAKRPGYSSAAKMIFSLLVLTLSVLEVSLIASSPTGNRVTDIDLAGCSLHVESSSTQVNVSLLTWRGPWRLHSDILNTGARKCFLKWESSSGDPATVEPGEDLDLGPKYSSTRPRLVSFGLLFGPDGPTNKATVRLFERGAP